jgi:hypothetical protein
MFAETTYEMASLQPQLLHRTCVRIGAVSLALMCASLDEIRLSRELEEFRTEDCNPDIEVNVEWAESFQACQGERAFDSGAVWSLFRDGTDFVFDFASPALGARPYKRLRADRNFRTAQLILSREALGERRPVFPLEYPADELLITNYLASGLGVEVHGCGLVDTEAGGQLFLGHSGAGKSTTTLLWKSLRNPEILSDDRIILRLRDGELWMYGTPWHGEAAFASAGKAKISRIFILQHGKRNEMVAISRSRAVGELFARCFPPFHSAAAINCTLGFLNRVVDAVPCYEFRFIPDSGAVEAVLSFHG